MANSITPYDVVLARMGRIDSLVPHVLPEVLPCPRSKAVDALRAVAVEFCGTSEVWRVSISDTVYEGEKVVDLGLEHGVDVVRVKSVTLGNKVLRANEYAVMDTSVYFANAVNKDTEATIDAVLRPARGFGNRGGDILPYDILDRYGDVLVYGALAKLKSMSGQNVAWSDASGASFALSLYNEGSARARIEALRRQHGTATFGNTLFVNGLGG
ncbi:MAG: hypothetical protein R3Y11_01795 [Pseudomonadota bacterium]